MPDEGVLDPDVVEWLEANPAMAAALEELTPEILELARGNYDVPVTREIAHVVDDEIDGVPVRIYRHDSPVTGLIVYFHGGGFVIGSISLMDGVARELAHATGAAVVSVGYRLAPEHPFPAGLDDCETVTRWALAHAADFGVVPEAVAVAGESAGGNLATAVALRLRDAGVGPLAAQVLIYPVTAAHTDPFPSRQQFSLVVTPKMSEYFWASYGGGNDIDRDPHAAPVHAPDLSGLPPALVLLAGCDMLRDEGRAYAGRLRDAGVDVEEHCYAGQPHGFVNMGLPAAADVYERVGSWLRARLPAQ